MTPIMLVSQPKSGSTWIYECLRRSLVSRNVRCARKEFFNPILNPAYQHVLARHVG